MIEVPEPTRRIIRHDNATSSAFGAGEFNVHSCGQLVPGVLYKLIDDECLATARKELFKAVEIDIDPAWAERVRFLPLFHNDPSSGRETCLVISRLLGRPS